MKIASLIKGWWSRSDGGTEISHAPRPNLSLRIHDSSLAWSDYQTIRDDLPTGLLKQVQLLLSYTHWLPVERCQISFYCDKLKLISSDETKWWSPVFQSHSILTATLFESRGLKVGDLVKKILKSKSDGASSEILHGDVTPELSDLGLLLAQELDEIWCIATTAFDVPVKDFNSRSFASEFYFESYEGEICVGFDVEAGHLLDRLVSTTMKKLQVFSIVGMAGLGKTTLARKVYDDPLIVYQFYIRAWVSFSQVYQKREMLLGILSSVTDLTDEIFNMNANMLAQVLYCALKGRRYLIVVDDIWSIEAWEDIKRSLPNDNNGSKIMLTSRLKDVALHAQSDGNPLYLRFLTEDESFDLFRKKAFLVETYSDTLNHIGKDITRKCRGLPLAIVVIAGLLRNNIDVDWWAVVAERVSSYIVSDERKYMDTLALSYNHLPRHLQRFFLYFGAFPEDTDISVRKLIWLWTAGESIVAVGTKSSEDIGEAYLMDLIGRSLIVVGTKSSDGAIKTCRIHDLLRDLCIEKAEEEKFSPKMHNHMKHTFSCPRCLDSYGSSSTYPPPNTQLRLYDNVLNISSNCSCISSELFLVRDISMTVLALDLLALDLSSIDLLKFPSELLHLIHLRYLQLRFRYGNPPESVSNLGRLKTLVMSSRNGIVVPESMWKLVSLRHLCIKSGENQVNLCNREDAPLLENLRTMSVVSPTRSCERILARSPNLRKLGFCGPLMTTLGELKYPDLGLLEHLESLKLLNTTPMGKPGALSSSIIFPERLKKLTVSNTVLDWKEAWIFEMMPYLEVLKLKFHAFVGKIWETKAGLFRRLKFLRFDELDIVTWRASSNHFPVLQHLEVHHCQNLKKIPTDFCNIYTLERIELSGCSEVARNSVKAIQKEQEDNGNDWLKILLPSR